MAELLNDINIYFANEFIEQFECMLFNKNNLLFLLFFGLVLKFNFSTKDQQSILSLSGVNKQFKFRYFLWFFKKVELKNPKTPL